MLKRMKIRAKKLKRETYTLYLIYQHPEISFKKRLFLGIVIGYAFCPIDLVPDFIPVLGYLDDLILVPLGISIALKIIPKEIYEECKKKARTEEEHEIPIGKKTAFFILFMWIIGLLVIFLWLYNFFKTLMSV